MVEIYSIQSCTALLVVVVSEGVRVGFDVGEEGGETWVVIASVADGGVRLVAGSGVEVVAGVMRGGAACWQAASSRQITRINFDPNRENILPVAYPKSLTI